MKVGLITYHSAYNFGSVLQAYATQCMVKEICDNCEIINYRTKEQKRIYSIFYRRGNFFKRILKNILVLLTFKERFDRKVKYENVFKNIFELSEECKEPEDVYRIWNKYDVIISGSDQIWNKNSNELRNVSWKYMNPYLLKSYEGKKVSYASSLTNMSDVDIEYIIDDVRKFDFLSFREEKTMKELKEKYDVDSKIVLDPTFLLKRDEWIKKFNLKENNDEKYILYYSLSNKESISNDLAKIKLKYKNTKIKVITPLNVFSFNKDFDFLNNIDPIDFLYLIYNAKTIITDSYHGTILSVNLNKKVYSLCRGNSSDFRKIDILKRLEMENIIISDIEKINEEYVIDYNKVNIKIQELRELSIDYLKKSLKEGNNG